LPRASGNKTAEAVASLNDAVAGEARCRTLESCISNITKPYESENVLSKSLKFEALPTMVYGLESSSAIAA